MLKAYLVGHPLWNLVACFVLFEKRVVCVVDFQLVDSFALQCLVLLTRLLFQID